MTMSTASRLLLIAALGCSLSACTSTPATTNETSTAAATSRSADAILADIDAVAMPEFDSQRRSDEAYVNAYIEQRNEATEQRNALILELYNANPNHERTIELMPARWQVRRGDPEAMKTVRLEVQEVARTHGPDTKLGVEARFAAASLATNEAMSPGGDPDLALAEVERFIDDVPDDPRAAMLLNQIASWGYEDGSDAQVQLFERVAETYADSSNARARQAANSAAGRLRQLDGVGQPFDFAFTCAVTGSEVNSASLAGKVVVVDFWATWCGPCVAEMPKMKSLYAKYRDQGVEFIGVSLDQPEEQGGLQKLLAFVEERDITWPQWYQGKGWQSEFSTSWGISGIPTLFIVDADGRLRSTTARQNLEELIVELLAERDSGASHAQVEVQGG